MAKIYMIGSQKGGVGKTTTTLNLAHSLNKLGRKVLCVDFDSQANLTTCFGIENSSELTWAVGELMTALLDDKELPPAEEYIIHKDGVDLIPSSIYLSVVCFQ